MMNAPAAFRSLKPAAALLAAIALASILAGCGIRTGPVAHQVVYDDSDARLYDRVHAASPAYAGRATYADVDSLYGSGASDADAGNMAVAARDGVHTGDAGVVVRQPGQAWPRGLVTQVMFAPPAERAAASMPAEQAAEVTPIPARREGPAARRQGRRPSPVQAGRAPQASPRNR